MSDGLFYAESDRTPAQRKMLQNFRPLKVSAELTVYVCKLCGSLVGPVFGEREKHFESHGHHVE